MTKTKITSRRTNPATTTAATKTTPSKTSSKVPTPATLAHKLGDIILDMKGSNLVVMQIDEVTTLADYLVIASASNRRQVQAIAYALEAHLKECGVSRRNLEGMEQGWWVLLDGGDVIVHIMQEEARRFYDIEMLWADGQVVRRSADVA